MALLVLGLAACAGRPATPSAPQGLPPPAYPAEARARLLRLLDGEWREWGGRVLDARTVAVRDDQQGPVSYTHLRAHET